MKTVQNMEAHDSSPVLTVPNDSYMLFRVSDPKRIPICVDMLIEGYEVQMEVDTGAAVSVISEATLKSLPKEIDVHPSQVNLKSYTGEPIPTVGQVLVRVQYKNQSQDNLCLIVTKGDGPNLLGRNWLQHFKLDWPNLCQVACTPQADPIQKYAELFKDELGCLRSQEADIVIPTNTTPIFCRPRPVPHALRDKIERELECLQEADVIEPVDHADWATPIVPVLKPDGSVRICGDYRLTVNKVAKLSTYPLPRIEDLFATLSGGKSFTKLDVAHAYLQIPLSEASRAYTTINTHKGLFRYKRLPFGISSAPSIFQKIMESILQGVPHVSVYIDDILLTGTTREEHLLTLETVLSRLQQAGLKLKRSKCSFFASSIEYLGHIISADGLHPTDEKVRAVRKAPTPTNVSQLKSFLGMITYYSKFLPNLASRVAPLYKLLEKNVQWKWTSLQNKAFTEAKESLTSASVLAHYNPQKELVLECDASPLGLGAVLSHPEETGLRPIAYASRTLSSAERNYSQLEREGLAIVWAVKKFHQFLYGRSFVIYSDHKPLESILNPRKHLSTTASARTQRWVLTLSAYDFKIKYKPGSHLKNADSLSRLPLPDVPSEVPRAGDILLLMQTLDNSLITSSTIRKWTAVDPVLSRVLDYVLYGWPSSVGEEFQPFLKKKLELSVEDKCLLWGNRVVVPPVGREKVLQLLHDGHPGITRMKALARSVVWWPGIDQQIENKVHSCSSCQEVAHLPAPVQIHPWEWPSSPWTRLHIDFAGPFLGRMFLIVVDAYSKWLEVVPVQAANTTNTIAALRTMFATHGLPSIIVSDNGTQFTSQQFADFLQRNGIQHQFIAPYHPSSYGLAERAVQTFKQGMKKFPGNSDIDACVARFLFHYRSTPHSTIGLSPAELLLKRKLKTHLDLLKPHVQDRIKRSQDAMAGRGSQKIVTFQSSENVYIRNWLPGPRWLSGKIASQNGATVEVILDDGRLIRRHVDHVRKRFSSQEKDDCLPQPQESVTLRRSTRNRHQPDRFQVSWN